MQFQFLCTCTFGAGFEHSTCTFGAGFSHVSLSAHRAFDAFCSFLMLFARMGPAKITPCALAHWRKTGILKMRLPLSGKLISRAYHTLPLRRTTRAQQLFMTTLVNEQASVVHDTLRHYRPWRPCPRADLVRPVKSITLGKRFFIVFAPVKTGRNQ